ncbi:MAG: hypothetical protein R2681_06665 [Pyrinomonadaceae bacterium]
MPERKDIWWKLAIDDKVDFDIKIAEELIDTINDFAIPFLNNFSSAEDVGDFLSLDLGDQYKQMDPGLKSVRLAYSSIIFFNLGEKDKAKQILETAVETAKAESSNRVPYDGHIEELRTRLFG